MRARRNSTIKKAVRILNDQKKDYKRIFRNEIRKSKNSRSAAVKAGIAYRTLYGSTSQKRWENALRKAKKN